MTATPQAPQSDLEIARAARLAPMPEIAAKLGIPEAALIPFGRDKAKVDPGALAPRGREGRLILVTAITPTAAGEGKTTTTVGLGDGLARIGKRTAICIREASLGPNFGMKGGAAGGGRAQVVPMEAMNLHFTGDFHAVTAAHNLLAAMVDNHIYWGNTPAIDPRRVTWRRVLDVNDRALREIVVGLGGVANGYAHEAGFDITAASEVMACLCLATDLADLEARLGRIVVGYGPDRAPVTCAEVGAAGAMTVLLKDALLPNLVQTLEGTPAFVHGGPFANIAHGCNTLIATRTALGLADYVVTEAGFGADLGAEKFFDIKCRIGGLKPAAAVIVATIRALKSAGGVAKAELSAPAPEALRRGCANLGRHIANTKGFGVPVVVAINAFSADRPEEIAQIQAFAAEQGVEAIVARHWAEGGAGAEDLARKVVALAEAGAAFAPLYPADLGLFEKIDMIARRIYHAGEVIADKSVRAQLHAWEAAGYRDLPVCMAKTPYSFSSDPGLAGAPQGHTLPIREVRLSAGAGFVVAICGEIMTMPGLPRHPAAKAIGLDAEGRIAGLF